MSGEGFRLPDRPADLRDRPVAVWSEPVVIPTYPELAPDRNPMFLEKRVYQGSSGRVYPKPFTDRVSDERIDAPWEAVHLENRYIRLMILPDIGGRIHVGQDQTNGYDFFYRQNVIKPALVGLLGPWICGGVEFNWPQHHRPATFMPVDWAIEERPDGSVTVWCSEHEPMHRMKGMHGIRLHPDSSLVEVRVRLYNRTPFVQTFLWWANVAARVHDQYQSFFPPDVSTSPTTRGARCPRSRCRADTTTAWTTARGRRRGGPDLVPQHPGADLVHGMGHGGLLRRLRPRRGGGLRALGRPPISPGKKQWTWGNHAFGHAWDRELTDADGPYVELMAGVFTDNQPDFSYLAPHETRTFSQFWYPIRAHRAAHGRGPPCGGLPAVDAGTARMGVAVTRPLTGACICSRGPDRAPLDRPSTWPPMPRSCSNCPSPREAPDLRLPGVGCRARAGVPIARPRRPLRAPATCQRATTAGAIPPAEQLFIIGAHLERYRHATRAPAPYRREALRRDPGDSRCNLALGGVAPSARRARRRRATPHPGVGHADPAQPEPGRRGALHTCWASRWPSRGAWILLPRLRSPRQAGSRAGGRPHKRASRVCAHATAPPRRTRWRRPNARPRRRRSAQRHRPRAGRGAPPTAGPDGRSSRGGLGGPPRRPARRVGAQRARPPRGHADRRPAAPRRGRSSCTSTSRTTTRGPGCSRTASRSWSGCSIRAGRTPRPIRWSTTPSHGSPMRPATPTPPAVTPSVARRPTDCCFPSRVEEIAVLETAELLDPDDPRAPYYLGPCCTTAAGTPRRSPPGVPAARPELLDRPPQPRHRRVNVRHRPVAARAAYLRARRRPPTTPVRSTSSTSSANVSASRRPTAFASSTRPARRYPRRPDGRAPDPARPPWAARRRPRGAPDAPLPPLGGRRGPRPGLWVRTNVAIARRSLRQGRRGRGDRGAPRRRRRSTRPTSARASTC